MLKTMREQSPYEGTFDRTGLVCLGLVTSVDNLARRLRVKTMGLRGTDDLDLHNVRVLGTWHVGGDEEIYLPRTGSYGVVIFLGTEAFWLGSAPLDMTSGDGKRANQVELNPGDKIIKTVANNRLVLRTGGTIELQSTELCRTFWIPSSNLISTVCQNFELETSGGYLKWTLDKKEETTNLKLKAWNSLSPDNGITLDVGTVPETANEEAGSIPGFEAGDLIFDFKQGSLKKEDLTFEKRSLRMSLKKDGSMFFDIGPDKFTMKIDGATGDMTFETKGSVKGLVKKDVNLTVEGAVTATVKKDISLISEGAVTATIKKDLTANIEGKANLTAKGGANITTDGDAKITAKGSANIDATGSVKVTSKADVTIEGTAGTKVGGASSPTDVLGMIVNLAGGGVPVARIGDMVVAVGNLGVPIIGSISTGSPKVTSG